MHIKNLLSPLPKNLVTNYNEILDDTIEYIDTSNQQQLEVMERNIGVVENIYKDVLRNQINRKYASGIAGFTVSDPLENIIKEYERLYNDENRF